MSPVHFIASHQPPRSMCEEMLSEEQYLHQVTRHLGDMTFGCIQIIPKTDRMGIATARLQPYCWTMISRGILSRLLRGVQSTESSLPWALSFISRYDAPSLQLEQRNQADYLRDSDSRSCCKLLPKHGYPFKFRIIKIMANDN